MKKTNKKQSHSLRITLPLAGSNQLMKDLLSHGLLLATEAKKMGGKARCLRSADAVIVVVSGVPRGQIAPLIDCMGHSTCMKDATLKVIVEELDTPGIGLESEGSCPANTQGNVSRKDFCSDFRMEPLLSATVVPAMEDPTSQRD